MASNTNIEFKGIFAKKGMQSYKKGCRRWDELKVTLTVILDLLYTKLKIKTEVRFLNNRNGRKNFVYNGTKHESNANFAIKPVADSPLTKALKEVRDTPAYQFRKLLMILFTDGAPTESRIESTTAITHFRCELEKIEGTQTYVSLFACTDQSGTVEYFRSYSAWYR
jgi:hypothetical protein